MKMIGNISHPHMHACVCQANPYLLIECCENVYLFMLSVSNKNRFRSLRLCLTFKLILSSVWNGYLRKNGQWVSMVEARHTRRLCLCSLNMHKLSNREFDYCFRVDKHTTTTATAAQTLDCYLALFLFLSLYLVPTFTHFRCPSVRCLSQTICSIASFQIKMTNQKINFDIYIYIMAIRYYVYHLSCQIHLK